jgi:hypothetical protein
MESKSCASAEVLVEVFETDKEVLKLKNSTEEKADTRSLWVCDHCPAHGGENIKRFAKHGVKKKLKNWK